MKLAVDKAALGTGFSPAWLQLKRNTGIFWPVIVILAVVLTTFYVLLPKIGEARERWQTLVKNRSEVETLSAKANFLSSIDQERLREDLRIVETVLPSEKDAILILTMIDGLTQATDTQVDTITLRPGTVSTESGQVEEGSEENVLSFSLTFTGSKENVESVLSAADKVTPLISISQVSLDYSTSGVAQADLSLGVHFLPLPTSLGELSQPLPELSAAQRDTLASLSQFNRFETAASTMDETSEAIRRKNLFSLERPVSVSEATTPAETKEPSEALIPTEATMPAELEMEIPIPTEELIPAVD